MEINAAVERLVRAKKWLQDRPAAQFAVAAVLGFVIAFFGSWGFLSYVFGFVLLALLVFAVLSMEGAKEDKPVPTEAKVLLSLLNLPDKPTAKVKDLMALRCFFLSITVLGGMTVGLFAAVPIQ